MGESLALFWGFVPMLCFAAIIYNLDPYEKEPRALVFGVFLWGMLVAGIGAFILNTTVELTLVLITNQPSAAERTTSTFVAPVIEEALKSLAVCLVFIRKRHEFDSILDGIVYAAITALGFAAIENTYYIYTFGYLKNGIEGLWFLVFIRVFLVGWQHPFYTAFFGIGLALFRTLPPGFLKRVAPLLGFGLSVLTHALHNLFATATDGLGALAFTAFDWFGWGFMFLFILYCIRREKRLLLLQLSDEVDFGTLSPLQYQTACHTSRRFHAHLTALSQKRYRLTLRFYQLCAELSHKKNQAAAHGDEQGNNLIIANLRSELIKLSPYAAA